MCWVNMDTEAFRLSPRKLNVTVDFQSTVRSIFHTSRSAIQVASAIVCNINQAINTFLLFFIMRRSASGRLKTRRRC